MVTTFTPNPAGIKYTFRSKEGPVGQHMAAVGAEMVIRAKHQVGVETGGLKNAITFRLAMSRGEVITIIEANHPNALMHHEGTKPHFITPQKVQVLKFNSNGKVAFAKAVLHPGTKPNRFLSDNLRPL